MPRFSSSSPFLLLWSVAEVMFRDATVMNRREAEFGRPASDLGESIACHGRVWRTMNPVLGSTGAQQAPSLSSIGKSLGADSDICVFVKSLHPHTTYIGEMIHMHFYATNIRTHENRPRPILTPHSCHMPRRTSSDPIDITKDRDTQLFFR